MTPVERSVEPLRGFPADATAEQRGREARFRSLIEPDNLREYLRVLSAEPHHSGSPGCRRTAEYILGRFRAWGLDARIEEADALLPWPVERIVELLEPDRFTARLEEPPIPEDRTSASDGQLVPFHAFSADGDVTAPLVYVNYGVPEDYAVLERLGVSVQGTIVIARYGGTAFRGLKPKTAAEHGAVGCLIYSDPGDDGHRTGAAYPDGPTRPAGGVHRGSVYYMPIQNGDPLTPGWGSEKGARRLTRGEAANMMPPIPGQPLSHADALPLLRALGGVAAPESWRGGLPIEYRVGPGPARVRLKVISDWRVRPIYNVIARIEGAVWPDQWIIRGNHHDAWVHGATDPGSGNVTLLETARAFGRLLAEGWRPRRTIVLASWDAEEWGLMGSTEWVERHAAELDRKAVAYINTDLTGREWLTPGGSHSLQRLVSDVARDVPQPNAQVSVFEAAKARVVGDAMYDGATTKTGDPGVLPMFGLGAETDYAAFMGHLGIASLDLLFDGAWNWRGVYHSTYDSFDWYTRFGDPTFEYGKALTATTGSIVLRLADAAVLPFGFEGLAAAVRGYVNEISGIDGGVEALDWDALRSELARLELAARSWELALSRVTELSMAEERRDGLEAVNRLVYRTERLFRYEPGLPDRPWFRHLLYASDPHCGRIVSTLPMIREGVARRDWDQAREFIRVIAKALGELGGQIERAAGGLSLL